jgi:hypothetical protein
VSVFPPHLLRPAAERDADALDRLAAVDSALPLTGDVLVAEERGVIVAAISLADGRTIADPFRRTAPVQDALRTRARALGAVLPSRSLRGRIRAALGPRNRLAPTS